MELLVGKKYFIVGSIVFIGLIFYLNLQPVIRINANEDIIFLGEQLKKIAIPLNQNLYLINKNIEKCGKSLIMTINMFQNCINESYGNVFLDKHFSVVKNGMRRPFKDSVVIEKNEKKVSIHIADFDFPEKDFERIRKSVSLENVESVDIFLNGNSGGKLRSAISLACFFLSINEECLGFYELRLPFKTDFVSISANRVFRRTMDGDKEVSYIRGDINNPPKYETYFEEFENIYGVKQEPSLALKKMNIFFDKDCASACELFLKLLEYSPNINFYTNSMSSCSLIYGGVVTLVLPRTKIKVNIPSLKLNFSNLKAEEEACLFAEDGRLKTKKMKSRIKDGD